MLRPGISGPVLAAGLEEWMSELMAGYVSSADTGNEDLVIASRAALADFCMETPSAVCAALVLNIKARAGAGSTHDRVVVSSLEIVAFLLRVGVFCVPNYKDLCLQVQKAGYKTGNVKKVEACVRVYGAVAAGLGKRMQSHESQITFTTATKDEPAVTEARRRLGALLSHPWPRVRSAVTDELWGVLETGGEIDKASKLLGTDWGRADKPAVMSLVRELGLV
jgi:hypothetical protein